MPTAPGVLCLPQPMSSIFMRRGSVAGASGRGQACSAGLGWNVDTGRIGYRIAPPRAPRPARPQPAKGDQAMTDDSQDHVHIIVSGENLSAIAKRYHVDINELLAANPQ